MADDLDLLAPFAAWVAPLEEVPDDVFSCRMLGDGIALDPLEGIVRAPCDGIVVSVAATGHSVTLQAANGIEILIHIGVDTVALDGVGFEPVICQNAAVRAGDILLRFDLDAVGRRAPSLQTPMIVLGAGHAVTQLASGRIVAAGEAVCRVASRASEAVSHDGDKADAQVVARTIIVPLPHGIHARPAARIGAALRPYLATIDFECNGRSANARSVTALLTLGVRHGDELTITGRGGDAAAAVDALADLIAGGMGESGDHSSPPAPRPETTATSAGEIAAVRAAAGGAIGPAFRLRIVDRELPQGADCPRAEHRALADGISRLRQALQEDARLDDIAEAHLGIIDDPELLHVAQERIAAGANAAQAWRDATRTQVDAIRATGNPLLIERIADLIDLERRLIDVLVGADTHKRIDVPAGSVLIADELLPSDFVAIDPQHLAAIVTAAGGPTSHVAILAASHGVPMLVAAGPAVLDIIDGTALLVQAERPVIAVDPAENALAAYRARAMAETTRAEAELRAAHAPCHTADGVRIEIFANCGSPEDAALAATFGAEGCGLLRTEFQFLDRATAPDEKEQAQAYAGIAARLAGRPVIVRTLDAGSDKPLAYLPMPHEANPALGRRGIRVSLARPEMLAEQFRAIIAGVPAAQRRIMLPMVNDLDEFRRARALLRAVEAELAPAEPTPLGIMVETPAAAMLADQLAREADFLSVGSNDLAQYTLAVDRGNAALTADGDALHPAVLRLIAQAARGAKANGKWFGICGAVASDVDAAPLLVGLGVDELSATPRQIPALKARISQFTLEACRRLATEALSQADAAGVRRLIGTSNAMIAHA